MQAAVAVRFSQNKLQVCICLHFSNTAIGASAVACDSDGEGIPVADEQKQCKQP